MHRSSPSVQHEAHLPPLRIALQLPHEGPHIGPLDVGQVVGRHQQHGGRLRWFRFGLLWPKAEAKVGTSQLTLSELGEFSTHLIVQCRPGFSEWIIYRIFLKEKFLGMTPEEDGKVRPGSAAALDAAAIGEFVQQNLRAWKPPVPGSKHLALWFHFLTI